MNLLLVLLIILSFIIINSTTNADYVFQGTLGHLKTNTPSYIQEQAVLDLIKRVIGEHAKLFQVKLVYSTNNEDFFNIEKLPDGCIQINGTTGVAIATGFNYYLKYYCNIHIAWDVEQNNFPKILPDIKNIKIYLNDRFRYYQNVCTTSYSFVWWDWNKWQKHIDWMALNSLNLVLAFNGQEAIWSRIYKYYNLTDDEINEHFSGPAFLSWLRMGNIRGWGGPLSNDWHERSLKLQKLILERMRSLGIIPVLPGFAGHLPRAFKRLFPTVKMDKMGTWNKFNDTFCCPYFLDPNENLFHEIGTKFIQEQIKEYGTDHIYSCDSFNENTPASTDLNYLANVGKSIFKALSSADPKAIWLMQNWLFVHDFLFWTNNRAKAILTSVPKGKMIVLDLQSEQFPQYDRLNQYFGQPYIWSMLHNFGGTLGMFGSSSIVNERPIEARNFANSTMVGIGLTPEGINQNYVIYDLMLENSWRKTPLDLSEWFKNYTIRRYGVIDPNAIECWNILQKTVYNYNGLYKIRGHYAITRTPSLKIPTWIWYPYQTFIEAWELLLKTPSSEKAFLYDVVDITRQALQISGDLLFNVMIKEYTEKNLTQFQIRSKKFLEIFDDLEEILASNENFLVGRWIEEAKNASINSQDRDLFEYNARNQISLWGPNGEIMNYANKQWSGVIREFFQPRWQLFINYLENLLINKETFNQNLIRDKMFREAEVPFTLDQHQFPVNPNGDTILIARKIYKKWVPILMSDLFYSDAINRQSKLLYHDNYD